MVLTAAPRAATPRAPSAGSEVEGGVSSPASAKLLRPARQVDGEREALRSRRTWVRYSGSGEFFSLSVSISLMDAHTVGHCGPEEERARTLLESKPH